jgi:DNA ligase D-like protein (predicted 3'-phosphoesterase)
MPMPKFVIQKHAASRLHYDFRLEVAGVLKSWTIPKGPSLHPQDRRLAVAVEDHSLGYGDFEGVLPQGTYGAGTVLLWDTGTYRNLTQWNGQETTMERGLELGSVAFWLEGKKLRGGYTLRRMKRGEENAWLLTKLPDAEARSDTDILQSSPNSVLSGRSLEEIAEQDN